MCTTGTERNTVNPNAFNQDIELPYALRPEDFQMAMQDVYDFFHDVNGLLLERGLQRLEETLRPAAMSGIIWVRLFFVDRFCAYS